HHGPSLRGWGNVVSATESALFGLVPARDSREAAVGAALRGVHDPEIPTVSIVDLGLVHRVSVTSDRISVQLLPTFVACPALEVIASTVRDALSGFGRPVDVDFTFEVPW